MNKNLKPHLEQLRATKRCSFDFMNLVFCFRLQNNYGFLRSIYVDYPFAPRPIREQYLHKAYDNLKVTAYDSDNKIVAERSENLWFDEISESTQLDTMHRLIKHAIEQHLRDRLKSIP
jgi:hypothetical protein